MDTKGFISLIVGILAVFCLLFGLGWAAFNEADENRDKGIEMTNSCIEAGFSGWDNYYGCIGGAGNND